MLKIYKLLASISKKIESPKINDYDLNYIKSLKIQAIGEIQNQAKQLEEISKLAKDFCRKNSVPFKMVRSNSNEPIYIRIRKSLCYFLIERGYSAVMIAKIISKNRVTVTSYHNDVINNIDYYQRYL